MAYCTFYTVFSIALFFTLHASSASPDPTSTLHHRLLLHSRNDPALAGNDNVDKLLDADMRALHLAPADGLTVSENGEFDGKGSNVEVPNYRNESVKELRLPSTSLSCDATYGVMPCSDTVIGNLVLVGAYGSLLFFSAKMLSEGSELLLTVLNAGVIGGLLLPILGALPDSILILVSGLGGSKSEAQEQVLVGIGLLAGSIVFLLTLLWGGCLILGRCDLEVDEDSGETKAIDKQLSKSFGLTDTGVEIDKLTQLSARIMIISVIPYIVAQLPRIFSFSSSGNIPVLIACIMALAGLLAYCFYQVFTPLVQQRRKEIARRKALKSIAIETLTRHGGHEKLVDERGNLNRDYAIWLFTKIDKNNDKMINFDELRAMLSISVKGGQEADMITSHFMDEFDENKNKNISEDEFLKGMQKWCSELKMKEKSSADYQQHPENFVEELRSLDDDDDDDHDAEAEKQPPSRKQLIWKAVMLLLCGTIIAGVFADPLVDAVDAFSTASGIPSFFVSFILLPLASNSSEAVSSIMFSGRKKKKNSSLTYSQIYGAVTMNSTMGLGIFLAVVYARDLVWDFSSEVLTIVLVTVIMGLLGSIRKVLPLWMAGFALLLYPLSLGLVAVLDYVAGWQ